MGATARLGRINIVTGYDRTRWEQVQVEEQGRGLELDGCASLRGIEAGATALNGRVTIGAAPSAGCRVTVEFPLSELSKDAK